MSLIAIPTQTGEIMDHFVTPDGVPRMLAAIPARPSYSAAMPWALSGNPTIPRAQWKPFNRRRTSLAIWDQAQEGACVAHGITRAFMKALLDSGQVTPMLARAMAYALVNGGRDAGADPADLVDKLQSVGICTEAICPYRFITIKSVTAAMYAEAKRFILPTGAVFACADFDEMGSAAQLGFHLGHTIRVAGNWTNLDSDGCPPAYRGTGNHEENSGDVMTQASNGEWLIETDGSWGTQLMNAGRHNVREAHFENQSGVQIFAFKFAGQDPLDPNLAPIVV